MLSRDSFEFSEVCIEDVCSACDNFKDNFSKVAPEEIEKAEECCPITDGYVCPLSEDTFVSIGLGKVEGELALSLLVVTLGDDVTRTDCYIFDRYIPFQMEADLFPQIYRLFHANEIDVY